MLRSLKAVAILAATTVIVSACASKASSPVGAAPEAGSDPAGYEFVSTAVLGHDMVPGSSIAVSFDSGRIAISAGCNTTSGSVNLVDGKISAPQMTQTLIGCEPALLEQDTWLAAFFASTPTWALVGDTLTLTSGRSVITMARTAAQPEASSAITAPEAPSPTLTSTRWRLTTILSAGVPTGVPAGVDPTITINGGRIAFDAQCNSVGGDVEATEASMTISAVIGTMMFCEGVRGEMEKILITVFDGTVDYVINDETLSVTGNGTELIFVADASGSAVPGASASAQPDGSQSSPVMTSATAPVAPTVSATGVSGKAVSATIDPVLQGLSFTTPIPGTEPVALISLSFAVAILTNASCNIISATEEQSTAGGSLNMGGLISTEMYCEGISEAETAWLQFLGASPTWSLDGSVLTLTSGDTSYALTSTT
ncbi:META domain-containing protein [Nakamurella antarctica]|uniref:META domain-containing protein n=1 Tax=Nakamurella antarctica TaxID=1902245 RepID=A0A3G8ZP35_9ACTN|nr:META domain-containing protein [Nakamurella antarctica]AZI58567.1 META domain-containing protein [Nakamurella antarctica]